LGWQIARNRATYLYYSFGINSLSLYESEGGDQSLTGTGMSESFGIGTKYINYQHQNNFSYTFGIEAKWNRLYISSVDASDGLSPIHGIDLRASGIFITTGILFGGKRTYGDIAYSYMINNDFISAVENFEYFLANEIKHGKRKEALKMLQYCESQIPYQQVNFGVEEVFETNYYEAVQWFDDAEVEANDELKIEIKTQRLNIANEIIDSVQNNKYKMSIEEAEQLIMIAIELMPYNKQSNQILAGLYYDKGIMNTDIGNYSEAIENYFHAVELYPPIESVVLRELEQLINAMIKDAFFSAQSQELHLVIDLLKTIIKLKPELTSEWDHYMQIIETQLDHQKNDDGNSFIQDYIKIRQQETISYNSYILQLGMTYKEVESIWGSPEIIDEMNDANQYFQMWTYGSEPKPTRLYFENNKLIRIEK
jgi:tetratricopeptide (TPR) repeat protein